MYYLKIFVFTSGMAVIGIELAAARLLAPFFGTSIFIWGAVIGVVLLALSLGYWYGGIFADQHPDLYYMRLFTIAAALYIACVPIFIPLFLSSTLPGMKSMVLLLGTGIAAIFFLFFVPIFFLGFMSPYAIRVAAPLREEVGRLSGELYAYSTLGSLIGAFVPAFVTIPFIGTRETLLGLSVLLLLVSLWGMKKKAWLLTLVIPILLYFFMPRALRARHGLLYETESPYQFIQVAQSPAGDRFLITNMGWGVQSLERKDTLLVNAYYDYFLPLPHVITPRGNLRALLIGVAGGTVLKQYKAMYTDEEVYMDAVEIDPTIVTVAEDYFSLDPNRFPVYIEDGRQFVRASPHAYDLILLDAYAHEAFIPTHLATQEFFRELRTHVTERGLVALNVIRAEEDSPLFLSLMNTIASVFSEVWYMPIPRSANVLVVASYISPPSFDAIPHVGIWKTVGEIYSDRKKWISVPGADIYTDNRSSIDFDSLDTFIQLL